jgi:hypothetical protein
VIVSGAELVGEECCGSVCELLLLEGGSRSMGTVRETRANVGSRYQKTGEDTAGCCSELQSVN